MTLKRGKGKLAVGSGLRRNAPCLQLEVQGPFKEKGEIGVTEEESPRGVYLSGL